jgi:hypothetical protein
MSTSLSGALVATRVPARHVNARRPAGKNFLGATAVARHLPVRWSVLRRLQERKAEDEIQDGPLPEPSDLISREDVFPEDGVEADEEGGGGENRGLRLLSAVPGPLIAAATFVPTFLAIFFGLSFLVGSVAQTGSTASTPAPSAAALMPEPSAADIPAPAIESTGPTLPPAEPRAAISSAPEPRAGRPAEAHQPQAAVLNTTPGRTSAVETRKGGRDWTPAAAFTDREAASRLASSIQQQGYPVEIRQEQSSSRPWVVWIGPQPRGAERRR